MQKKSASLHDTAALRALAEGRDFTVDRENMTERIAGEPVTGKSTFVSAGLPGQYVSEHGAADASAISPKTIEISTSAAVRRMHMYRYEGKQKHHMGIQFRKTAVPLLLTMAALLLTTGVYTILRVRGSHPDALAGNTFLANGNGALFASLAIGLGLCLLGGGLFFHYEVRKQQKIAKKKR